ncbi:hypothetical protein IWQ56_005355, partial [Coemansia nantahalensis]
DLRAHSERQDHEPRGGPEPGHAPVQGVHPSSNGVRIGGVSTEQETDRTAGAVPRRDAVGHHWPAQVHLVRGHPTALRPAHHGAP